jgi:hypothetical protein
MTGVWGTLIIWVALIAASITHVSAQQATPAPPKPAQKFTPWNGSFAHQFDIEVPDFRDLEPDLTLTYDSARKVSNFGQPGGELGIGWSLSGLSVIERVSGTVRPTTPAGQDKPASARGLPHYGLIAGLPEDSFTLDGQELIACSELQNSASSPSCVVPVAPNETTYTTRIESFLRIRRIGETWTVTNTRGIISTYSAETADTKPHRLYIKSTVDRRGNKISYTWNCNTTNHCNIASIKYLYQESPTVVGEIVFHSETRPDPYTYASGKDLRIADRRITTIEVKSAGATRQAYALNYELSASTGLSRLISVQQYGRDAVISAGKITGGTNLPATVLGYTNNGATAVTSTYSTTSFPNLNVASQLTSVLIGDLNGDSLSDIHAVNSPYGSGALYYLHATPSGFVPKYEGETNALRTVGDFNGDGTDESLMIGNSFQAPGDAGQRLQGDFNGDGTTDIAWPGGTVSIYSNGVIGKTWNSTPAYSLPSGQSVDFNHHWTTGDFNGDGKTDILDHGFSAGNWWSKIYFGAVNGFVAQSQQTIPWVGNFDTTGWIVADANGDGLTDVIAVKSSGSTTYSVTPFLSNGKQFIAPLTASVQQLGGFTATAVTGFDGQNPNIQAGDFNGDGRIDLLLKRNTVAGELSFVPSTSIGFAAGPYQSIAFQTNPNISYMADFDGNGRTDVFKGTPANNMIKFGAGPNDLLSSIKSPLGGTTAIAYKSSAGTPNTRIPFIMQLVDSITTNDGRGTIATTHFTYDGGSWDREERQFMGFRTVTATLPANVGETARPQVVSTYQQSFACLGRVATVEEKDGAGKLLRTRKDKYNTDTAIPRKCLATSSEEWLHDSATPATVKKVKTTREFDAFGNVIKTNDLGHYVEGTELDGDEVTTVTSFYNIVFGNAERYLVGCPYQEVKNNSAGAQIARRFFVYEASDELRPYHATRLRLQSNSRLHLLLLRRLRQPHLYVRPQRRSHRIQLRPDLQSISCRNPPSEIFRKPWSVS